MACLYRNIVFCLWVPCCLRRSSWMRPAKLLMSPGFALLHSKPTLRGWSHHLTAAGWSLCVQLPTLACWFSRIIQFQGKSLNCPTAKYCFDLQHSFHVWARWFLEVRRWEALFQSCFTAAGRCEVRNHCRALLPLLDMQHAPTAPGCDAWAFGASLSLLLCQPSSTSSSSSCYSFVLHRKPCCLVSVPSSCPAFCCSSSLSENSVTLNTLVMLYCFLFNFKLFCRSICYPSVPRRSGSWCLDPTAKAAERQIVADLVAAAGWKGTANIETGVLGDLGQQSGCGDNPADSYLFWALWEPAGCTLSHKELLYSLELLSGKEINKHFEILLTECLLIL